MVLHRGHEKPRLFVFETSVTLDTTKLHSSTDNPPACDGF
jgi:hypothetical protein